MPAEQQKPSVDVEILTVAVRPRIGGMTTWIEQIASGLSKKGFVVRLLGFADTIDREWRDGYELVHIRTSEPGSLPFSFIDKFQRWRTASKCYRNQREEGSKPRLLISDGTPGILKLASEVAKEEGIPWIALTGGNVFAEIADQSFASLLARNVKRSMNAATRILVDGEDLVEALVANGIDADRVRVQRQGIDLSRFKDRADPPRFFNEESSSDRIKLVWHGRLSPYHGPMRFLDIATRIEGADARFCGVGPDQGEVERFLSDNGKEDWWLGQLTSEDLGPFLAEGDLGVYPLKEMAGVPTVLLESMAAGLPTLSYPTGDVTNLICHDDNGFICDDDTEMIRTIERLSADPETRRRIGDEARKTIEEDWSEEPLSLS